MRLRRNESPKSRFAGYPISAWRPLGQSIILCLLTYIVALQFSAKPAVSQTCGEDYIIQERETLAAIAERVYGDRSQWTLMFYANQDRLGAGTTLLLPGHAIRIPCINPAKRTEDEAPSPVERKPGSTTASEESSDFEISSMVKRIEFLTAEGYTPFADRSLENGGLLLDLLTSSMDLIRDQAEGAFSYNISWVNDWAAHLNPLLITRAFDVGIPWAKLDCSDLSALDTTSRYKCQKFFFSEPLYEDFTALIVKKDSPITFAHDEEILGKTLCRTRGRSVYYLNKKGRGWLKDNKIILMQPQTAKECFRLLDQGAVDAVVISDLTGRAVAASMGLLDKIRVADRPVHIQTMHAIVAKTHPHARTLLYYINSSIAKLRETGAYDKIVAKHLERYWANLEKSQPTDHTSSIDSSTPPHKKP